MSHPATYEEVEHAGARELEAPVAKQDIHTASQAKPFSRDAASETVHPFRDRFHPRPPSPITPTRPAPAEAPVLRVEGLPQLCHCVPPHAGNKARQHCLRVTQGQRRPLRRQLLTKHLSQSSGQMIKGRRRGGRKGGETGRRTGEKGPIWRGEETAARGQRGG